MLRAEVAKAPSKPNGETSADVVRVQAHASLKSCSGTNLFLSRGRVQGSTIIVWVLVVSVSVPLCRKSSPIERQALIFSFFSSKIHHEDPIAIFRFAPVIYFEADIR